MDISLQGRADLVAGILHAPQYSLGMGNGRALLLLSALVLGMWFERRVDAGREPVSLAREAVVFAKRVVVSGSSMDRLVGAVDGDGAGGALVDCVQLYEDSEYRLQRLSGDHVDPFDAQAAVSAALTSHNMCIDGLVVSNITLRELAGNVTRLLRKALAAYAQQCAEEDVALWAEYNQQGQQRRSNYSTTSEMNLLASWDQSTRRADYVVAKDGSGNYMSINEAMESLGRQRRGSRVVIYVKAGVYTENVEMKSHMTNVMLVGDGIDRTVVTGRRSAADGSTLLGSATFGARGDGFWARGITFENMAGPEKHQAVAIRISSDRSVFYQCSFRGYQDTLFVVSGRQFFRDCDVYGTIDFIFGNAIAVLQNCNIIVRRPMSHQANMITAQGRDDPGDPTGISIHMSRVLPAGDLVPVKGEFKTFLGRPWKKYSRTVYLKTNLDGMLSPQGWAQWRGGFALKTLFYGEYMNIGEGAQTGGRVNWPGFHILRSPAEAEQFTVGRFLRGQEWLPETGVPFMPGL